MNITIRALGVGAILLGLLLGGIFLSAGNAKAPVGGDWRDKSRGRSDTARDKRRANKPPKVVDKPVPVPQAGNNVEWDTTPVTSGTDRWEQLCRSTTAFNDAAVVGGTPWKRATASTFYIGEEAGPSNANITNISTAWSTHAVTDFGSGPDRWGPKNPEKWSGAWYERDGWCMKGDNMVIKQNPFYVALPTPDYDEKGPIPEAQKWVAFAAKYLPELKQYPGGKFSDGVSPFKNLWVAVEYKGKIALAQLEDIGPSDSQGKIAADYAYVWDPETTNSKNTFGVGADLDLSPALSDYLGAKGDAEVRFRFIPADQVKLQPGPWTVLVTTSGPNW